MAPTRPNTVLPATLPPARRRRRPRVARGALLLCVTALGAGLAAAQVLGRRLVSVTVRGRSMEPGYHDGDRVLVQRGATPSPGQVVVIEQQAPDAQWRQPPLRATGSPRDVLGRHWIIKRVAAVPGDPVPRAAVPALSTVPEQRVPAGRLVLLGDNPRASLDSRHYGYFPAERVLGTVRGTQPPQKR